MNEIEKALSELKGLLSAGISGIDLEMFGMVSEDSFRLAISALEKQIPKKALGIGVASEYGYEGNNFICGCCPSCFKRHIISDYCEDCGQAIDWSVEE